MNLAEYLSELLGRYDEVNVPGLGYFIRERVSAHYDNAEAKFYPPYHKVKFVAQPKDDDSVFTQYVAGKKNISLASSQYFTEKFVSKLREESATGSYPFADLGVFYTENDQLVFKPNVRITNDPAFYGYPEINVSRPGQTEQVPLKPVLNESPVYETPVTGAVVNEPVVTETAISEPSQTPPVILQPEPVQSQPVAEDELYPEDAADPKRGMSIWLWLLIIITVIALAIFVVYQFYPATYNKLRDNMSGKNNSAVVPVYKPKATADTNKKTAPVSDSINKPSAAAVSPVVSKDHWEIIEFSVRRQPTADAELARLKAKGVEAKIITDTLYRLLRVSAGTFSTKNEADSVMNILVKQGKIRKKSKTLEINP